MPKKPSDRLHKQLDQLFTGLPDPTQSTRTAEGGAAAAELRGPSGWIWESDAAGRYTWCSPEVERILGHPAEELIGKEVASVALSDASAALLRQALAGSQPVRNLKLDARAQDGRGLTLLLNSIRRSSPTGGPAGHRGVVQIVSVRPADAATPSQSSPPPVGRDNGERPPQIRPATPPAPTQRERVAPPATPTVDPMPANDEYEEEARLARMTAHEIEGTSEGPSARVLRVPVRTQDGLYATLEFEAEADGEAWSQDDRLLVEAISQQLGTAIQDARTHALTQQALVEMREADRLKTQFLANMSHELRTPLNSIIGFSRVILKGIDGPISDLQEQDLRAIYNAGLHLLGLINDILDLSKIEARKMELALADLDLAEMIRGVMATAVGLVHDKPVELGVDVPQDLPRLQADTMRVRQILLNLVSNAAKFTERGRIDVVARLTDRQGIPEIEVAVSDTGPGIDTQAQAKLFEPFTQVDSSSTRKTGGTGLGLSICRHLVELHGGRIWVESVAGQGSTFKFTLPLRPPAGALVESGAAST
ncbi:MAG: ATP-binding protein [Anaerolineales bacterium]